MRSRRTCGSGGKPGSELFLVFFEGRSTEPPRGREPLQNRGVIVTVNRLFRW